MQFHIENMECEGCAKGVTRVINAVDANAKVDADAPKRTVTIETSAARDIVEEALISAGWDARDPT
jgi:copper chaperone